MNIETPQEPEDEKDIIDEATPSVEPIPVPTLSEGVEDIVDDPEKEENSDTEFEDDDDEDVINDFAPIQSEEREREVPFSDDNIDFRGEDEEYLDGILDDELKRAGPIPFDAAVRTPDSWENLVLRAITDQSLEEQRIREALGNLSEDERKVMSNVLRSAQGKTLLRTSPVTNRVAKAGETRKLSGDEALLAFESISTKRGGGFRVVLYNSGLSLDVLVPTGNDFQLFLNNCIAVDQQLGASSGAHYFAYADVLYKANMIKFLQPLIVNSSYASWKKNGKLWSIIKLPDLSALIMTIAAMIHKNGFENFRVKCTRKKDAAYPDGCKHTEQVTADLSKMILTRWPVLSEESVKFLVNTRMPGAKKNTTQEILQYQKDLGLEGERITVDDVTFVMRIPTIEDYLSAGNQFLSEIINEVEADNTDAVYEQVGFRYVRTFRPWIARIENAAEDGSVIETDDTRVIIRQLEQLKDQDTENKLVNQFRHYINKSQLTYIGFPATPCPVCNHVADTPSGLLTIDPFTAFFTIALTYWKATVSVQEKR